MSYGRWPESYKATTSRRLMYLVFNLLEMFSGILEIRAILEEFCASSEDSEDFPKICKEVYTVVRGVHIM
jgi:hypothetical protein